MARISWGKPQDRMFEAGLDRGVLYPPTSRGVPWNGLVSVDQRATSASYDKTYMDGRLIRQSLTSEDFSGKIQAFTYPEELDYLTGYGVSVEGILFDSQLSTSFGFSYRTLIGDAVTATELGYKIHLVYNALAVPETESHNTLTDTAEPETFTWNFETTPVLVSGFKPTSHLVFDTTLIYPGIVSMLESILYGSSNKDPRLPTISEILNLKNNFDLVRINENEITGLSPLVVSSEPDLIGELDRGYFTETRPTRLRNTPVNGLSDLDT